MRKIMPLLCLLLLPLSALRGAEGWVALFNGNDLTGWTIRGGQATYAVEDGMIVGTNGPGQNTFLCTEKTFGDFELEFEVRLLSPLNSGVQIRSKARQETEKGVAREFVYGPQVEIEQSPGEAGYVYGERIGGWMTPEAELKAHSHFRNEEWNRYRIVAEGPRIRTWINGQPVADVVDAKVHQDHAAGLIGLQVHSTGEAPPKLKVAWRNLRIRELASAQR